MQNPYNKAQLENLSYSQNFIKNNSLIKRLIAMSRIRSDDLVIDIGAGKGKITKLLAEVAGEVLAVEKDPELYEHLVRNNDFENVKFINDDFINFPLPRKLQYKIFANIPFNHTAEIMKKILDDRNPPTDAFIIMQEEASQRFTGILRSESQISAFYKAFFNFEILHSFKAIDFTPVPKVHPVMLAINRLEKPFVKVEHKDAYRKFIKYGFGRWAKNIEKALDKVFTYKQLKRLSHDLKFNLSDWPSEVPAEAWVGMFNYFITSVEESKKRIILR